jgi:deoxyadenosine/deoxycytidine kinase
MSAPITNTETIVISVDANIGAGKSYLMEILRVACPDWEIVVEPVAEWVTLKNGDGKSLLELFYEDKRRWAYTFQNCAILTRLRLIKEKLATTKKRVLITERSVLTDRYVFAEMLRDAGDIDALEWQLYLNWFNTFAADLPVRGIVHLTTGVGTSAERIVKRGRHGEEHIPLDYLSALDSQHNKWLSTTELPVLRISTEAGVSMDANVDVIKSFVAGMMSS